jgi:hypothetical protein
VKRYVSLFSVLILLLLAASCGGGATVTVTQPPATPAQTPVAVVETTPTPTPAATPTPTPETPSPTPSTEPEPTPTAPATGPDITPYNVEGDAAIVVDNQVSDYQDITIKAGVTNIGNAPAKDVVVELKKGTTTLYEWNFKTIAASQKIPLEVTVGEIMEKTSISAGVVSLMINCVARDDELSVVNNWMTQNDLKLALPPAPRGGSQSVMGKKVQDAIDNSTWYTETNKQELLDIVKDILKDNFPYWNVVHVFILPYDDYNDLYAQKNDNKQPNLNRYKGNYFYEGYINGATIYVREGTFFQVLPDLLDALGLIFYAQKNYDGYRAGLSSGADVLAGHIYEAYGIAFMRENYGLDGFLNVSVLLDASSYPDIAKDVNTQRLWAIAADKGYPDGGVPAKTFLDEFKYLTGLGDPSSYVQGLNAEVNSLDKVAIKNLLSWRMVDKELTMLPYSAASKISPDNNKASLDIVIVSQSFIAYPW